VEAVRKQEKMIIAPELYHLWYVHCAVERDALSGRGSCLSPGASAYQRIISHNSYANDEQGVNPGQVRPFDALLSADVTERR